MTTGVVVVTYNARDVICDCLESLLASTGADLRIVVVDNASRDDTVAVIRNWAAHPESWSQRAGAPFKARSPAPVPLTTAAPDAGTVALITSPVNTGYAGGVNTGLRLLKDDPNVDYFWVLNPDCITENGTAARLEQEAARLGRFGLIGGRVFYKDPPLMIQSDGGRINFTTGTSIPFNLGLTGRDVPQPPEDALDYISGSHMFASRAFLERAGLLPEEYFLYYEEMDWCCRRGDLPIHFCTEAAVHHDGGHTLGSATMQRGPSAMAAYFMGRSRMKFMRRYNAKALPVAFAYCLAKACKHALKGHFGAARGLVRGICGLPPTAEIQARLKPHV